MDFQSIIKNIEWFKNTKEVIGEEATKLYLIYPFLSFLGYDIHSPYEVKFEYECDMHENGSRRVDCAILNDDGKSLIIVEAKAFGKNLDEFVGQIKSYFVSSGAQYAFLTDGNKYLIFDKEQITGDFYLAMPKVQFCLDSLHEADIKLIGGFAKINLKNFITKKELVVEELADGEEIEETSVNSDITSQSIQAISVDVLESFAIGSKDFLTGKSVESVYYKYVDLCNSKNSHIVSIGKFENYIKEKLDYKCSYSTGKKYFVKENTAVDILNSFVNDIGTVEFYDCVCDEMFRRYKDYCNENECIALTKNVFCREVVISNKNIAVVRKKLNGIIVDFFTNTSVLNTDKTLEINDANLNEEEKGVIKFCGTTSIDKILNRSTREVYEEYCNFCVANNIPVMVIINWSKKMKNAFGLKIGNKRTKGVKRRIFIRY